MRIALTQSASSQRPARLSLRSALALLRSRRALAALAPEQLQDVGLTSEEAQAEAQKPVWDAPASWKC
ncbi:DUF1127 domain-containing protein [uncultured Sulfitobacter sp.]|uniref:DUF1127 domain-containing protein n=1 Tax=uncultured Sulfitobacter sp. TaxID=191468 RepID=UPI00261DF0F6|nr:DUF1127 domain-containing protein [uncultured Sulfitobacter sp.]